MPINRSSLDLSRQINVRSHTFEQIFGSSVISIRPQGSAEMIMAGQINTNQNPLI